MHQLEQKAQDYEQKVAQIIIANGLEQENPEVIEHELHRLLAEEEGIVGLHSKGKTIRHNMAAAMGGERMYPTEEDSTSPSAPPHIIPNLRRAPSKSSKADISRIPTVNSFSPASSPGIFSPKSTQGKKEEEEQSHPELGPVVSSNFRPLSTILESRFDEAILQRDSAKLDLQEAPEEGLPMIPENKLMFAFSQSAYTVKEYDGQLTVSVLCQGRANFEGDVHVSYETEDGTATSCNNSADLPDFVPNSGVLTFKRDVTELHITIDIIPDHYYVSQHSQPSDIQT